MVTIVNAFQCVKCNDIIYSRAHHDFRYCSCGCCFVDGGFEYTHCGWETDFKPKQIQLPVNATKQELYEDWNFMIDAYDIIKGGCTA